MHSASVDTKYSNSSDTLMPMESAPNVYDKKASVILNRSLARTTSNTSFRANLADSIGSTQIATNSNHSNKRSYIPFRSSRHGNKARAEVFSTPKYLYQQDLMPMILIKHPLQFSLRQFLHQQ